jgi:rhodanese-related sulfurtransferase
MKKSFLCLSIFCLATVFAVAQTRLKEDINCKKAMKLIQKHRQDTNFVILDVRTPEEFKNGHIEKAIIIDYKSSDFQDKISMLDKKKTYLVYCKGGGRSTKSIEVMKNLNFNNLYHLFEGMETWAKGGYKTVIDK